MYILRLHNILWSDAIEFFHQQSIDRFIIHENLISIYGRAYIEMIFKTIFQTILAESKLNLGNKEAD